MCFVIEVWCQQSNKKVLKQGKTSWYKVFQALSFDVVIGAIIFTSAIGRYFKIVIPFSILTCLSVSIWVIYTFDHLLDAKKILGIPSTYRHRFHRKYYKSLIIIILVSIVFGVINSYYLPKIIFYIGVVGMLFTTVYFLIIHKISFWAKEIYVAVLYTSGIFIGPVYFSFLNLHAVEWMLIPQVFLLVLSNLLLFSWFDFKKDMQDGHQSIAIYLGQKKTKRIVEFILIVGIILSFTILILNMSEPILIMQIVLLMMYGLLFIILEMNTLFKENDLYRIIGDGVFFIPLFFILYAELRHL